MTNLYLEEFLRNSREAREELLSIPNIVESIEEKLKNKDGWNRGTFNRLIPGKFGLKQRGEDQAIVEMTSIADLYKPELNISPFAVPYKSNLGHIYYIVKDWGDIPMIAFTNSYKQYKPIQDAITHMILKGYGTKLQDDLTDKNIVEYRRTNSFILSETNLWSNIFLFDDQDAWAMIDFDFMGILINEREIYEGAEDGTGRFTRLNDIWKILNSEKYMIKL